MTTVPDTIPAPAPRPRLVLDLSAGPTAAEVSDGLDPRGLEVLAVCLRAERVPAVAGLMGAA